MSSEKTSGNSYTTGKSPIPFSLLSFNEANIMNTLASPSKDFFTCSAVKKFPPILTTGLENVILLVKQLMLTPKDNIWSICFNGGHARSNSKSTLPKLTGHLAHTKEVVTEPLGAETHDILHLILTLKRLVTWFPTLEAIVSFLTITSKMTQSSTFVASHISNIRLRASTNLLSLILVVRFPKSLTLSFLIMQCFVMVRLDLTCIIKHTTLVHQSIEVSNLLNTQILKDLWPQTALKLPTLRNHCILGIDVRTKPRKLFKLSSVLRNTQVFLLQVQELYFLLGPQILRKVLPQKFTLNLAQVTTSTPASSLPFASSLPPAISFLHKNNQQIRTRAQQNKYRK